MATMADLDGGTGIARDPSEAHAAGLESGEATRSSVRASVERLSPGRADQSLYSNTPDPDETTVAGQHPAVTRPVAGALLNDRFRLGRELGRGGMATVYLAEEIETGRQVAVKMM